MVMVGQIYSSSTEARAKFLPFSLRLTTVGNMPPNTSYFFHRVRIGIYFASTPNRIAFEQVSSLLFTQGLTGRTNLDIDRTDIPAIIDIDGDGDMDILNFQPAVGGIVELHLNESVERGFGCDSLIYRKIIRWGNFEECDCDNFVFGAHSSCRVERLEHAGSTLLVLDLDADDKYDLVLGDVGCNNLAALSNGGATSVEAEFRSAESDFPTVQPVDIAFFPAAYYEDVDFDGVKDLLVSPNLYVNELNQVDFQRSVWLYKNTGENNRPVWNFQQTNFLQDQMLDIGEDTHPFLYDIDGDGDQDLFLAQRGSLRPNGEYRSTIAFYENTTAGFQFRQADFFGFESLNLQYIRPALADLDGDGKDDLALVAFHAIDRQTYLYWLPNADFGVKPAPLQRIDVGLRILDEPNFFDLDGDGKPELLVGRFQGGVSVFKNQGNNQFTPLQTHLGNLPSARRTSLCIADFDGDGAADLVLADSRGYLHLYSDFIQTLEEGNDWHSQSEMVYNPIKNQLVAHQFGEGIYPIAWSKDLLLGTVGGGLFYLRRSDSPFQPSTPTGSALIFPNPTDGRVSVLSETDADVIVLNSIGQKVAEFALKANHAHAHDLAHLARGLYFFRISDSKGVKTYKVVRQ
jgi:hypothetical protein